MYFPVHLLFLLLLCCTYTDASSGDRSPEFSSCVLSCQETCPRYQSLVDGLTSWTCTDECKYECMHQITDLHIKNGEEVLQYFGKWPFWRILGMQEPASVAFSVLNFCAQVYGLRKIRRIIPERHPMKGYYVMSTLIGANAWIWSAVFHTRDLPITEKLDYFSAALVIFFGLYATIIRLFHLYPSSLSSSTDGLRRNLTRLCVLVFIAHVSYLTIPSRFDYTYNIIFNLIIGLAHNVLWLVYSVPLPVLERFKGRPRDYIPECARKALVLGVLMTFATGLEVFDFPPWQRSIDAHSLWHLATAPIAVFWYDFLIEDALDEGWRVQKS